MRPRETELSPIRVQPETLTYTPSLQEEIDGTVNVCTLEFNTHLINSTVKVKDVKIVSPVSVTFR